MIVKIEKANSPAATAMIAALNADLACRYPGSPIFGIDAKHFETAGGVFAIGYEDEAAVASGALRPWLDAIEVKRMFVRPSHRGRGLAKAMMAFLQDEAKKRGYLRMVLETGSGQPEAIALYRRLGWVEIAPFGPYAEDQRTREGSDPNVFRHVCFERHL